MNMQVAASQIIAACGYFLVASVLCAFPFKTRELRLGLAFGWLLGALLAAGLLHLAMLPERKNQLVAAGLVIACAADLPIIGLALWLFLRRIEAQVKSAVGQKIQRKLNAAAALTARHRNWLELAEQIANVGHWSITVPGNELFWSDEIYRIHGVDKHNFVPDIPSGIGFYHPEDRTPIVNFMAKSIQEKHGYEVQARIIRPTGEVRHIISRGTPQLDALGQLTSLFGVFVDITDQKRAEEKLLAANLEAERANAALTELAMEDSLTGLGNRRKFDLSLELEFSRALRGGASLGLIMIDLDGFKSYNDFYGHPAGDICLRQVAQAILSVPARPGDLVARYGGEEIAVLLPLADEEGARVMAQLICDAVRLLGVAHHNAPAGIVTVSCGVASFLPTTALQHPRHLVESADRALYEAKRAGRDQVVCHGKTTSLVR